MESIREKLYLQSIKVIGQAKQVSRILTGIIIMIWKKVQAPSTDNEQKTYGRRTCRDGRPKTNDMLHYSNDTDYILYATMA
jgi:hypothetical protein